MRKIFATVLLVFAFGCGPGPLNSSDPQLDASDEIGEQANYARKHMSDRGVSSEEISYEVSTADDVVGEQANYTRQHLNDRGISSEQLEDLGVMTAEDAREYLYQRGICESRHGDNCNGKPQDGKDGSNGQDGKNGNDGVDGRDGAKGDKGDAGDTGPAGQDGAAGKNGEPGTTGAAGPQGNDGATGPKGDTGDTGPQGDQGPQGEPGVNGVNGTNGQSCTVEWEFDYAIGYGHGRKCYYDGYVQCVNGSIKIVDDEKAACNGN